MSAPMTVALRRHAIPADNWLSKLAKVPYDASLPGMHPRNHRAWTFGHDPLLGMALGTLDIMRGSMTDVRPGWMGVTQISTGGVPFPVALGVQVLHLLSDIGTPMGLPLPGWTALVSVGGGSFGPAESSLGALATLMYMRGYSLWHLPAMATSVAVTEAVIRGYLALRQLADDDYGTQVDVERIRAGATRVTHEPRYRALAAVAHGLAAAGNAGKVAVTGNPLGINVVQWSRAASAISHHLQVDAPGDTLVGQAAANRHAIDLGWARLGWIDLPTIDL